MTVDGGAPATGERGHFRHLDRHRTLEGPATPDAVNIRIYISGEFGSGFIDLAPDGAIKHEPG